MASPQSMTRRLMLQRSLGAVGGVVPLHQQIEQLPGMLDQVTGAGHLQFFTRAKSPKNSHGPHAGIARRLHVD